MTALHRNADRAREHLPGSLTDIAEAMGVSKSLACKALQWLVAHDQAHVASYTERAGAPPSPVFARGPGVAAQRPPVKSPNERLKAWRDKQRGGPARPWVRDITKQTVVCVPAVKAPHTTTRDPLTAALFGPAKGGA